MIAASVDTFDKDDFVRRLADLLGLPLSAISVRVTPASIALDVNITTVASAAETLLVEYGSVMENATDLAVSLGFEPSFISTVATEYVALEVPVDSPIAELAVQASYGTASVFVDEALIPYVAAATTLSVLGIVAVWVRTRRRNQRVAKRLLGSDGNRVNPTTSESQRQVWSHKEKRVSMQMVDIGGSGQVVTSHI